MITGNTSSAAAAPQAGWSSYVRIARPDHWIKNIFVLPGIAIALAVVPGAHLSWGLLGTGVFALLSVCLIASANYTINEFLDASSDRHHPLKRLRPGAQGMLNWRLVGLQYVALAIAGAMFAGLVNRSFLWTSEWLLVMGILYNVRPVRSKDRAVLDVLSESVNNPIRLLLGWFLVAPAVLPPASALLAYWMGGAFLMTVKRYSEYRRIGDPVLAASYRRSFGRYTETRLLLQSLFYAICSAFFIGIFLIKYRVGLVLSFPLFAVLFTWYLAIGLRDDSAAQAPEKLYRETAFMAFAALTFTVVALLFVVDVPVLNILVDSRLLPAP